jgi:hypothetical protein
MILECRPNLIPLTSAEMVEYGAAFGNTTFVGAFVALGSAQFLNTNSGFVVTCQCEPNIGNSCYLEFDNALSTFITLNATSFGITSNADGSYFMLLSSLVTCDNNGLNVINGTTSTHYTCYSYTYQNISNCC